MLRTLGGLAVEGEACPRKPALALCYLALEGPQPRRRLATLLWPDTARPLSNLSVALSALRRVVPGRLYSDAERVSTSLPSDVDAMLAALERGHVDEAVRHYHGPFLHAVPTDGCSRELVEWIFATREVLAGRLRSGLLRRAEAYAESGALAEAARLAERGFRLAGAPPAGPDELCLLHDVFRFARHPAAREVAREASDLGLDLPTGPSAPGPAWTAPSGRLPQLPRPARPLVGRDRALAELADLLDDPECRLLTLVGPGGIGKSRLALQLARERRRSTDDPGDAAFVELESLPPDADVAAAVARALGLDEAAGASLDRLAARLADRPLLLVLDGVEHLPGIGRWCARLVDACPGPTLLVTSRERLRTPVAWTYRLGGLPLPATDASPERAARADPVRLFVACARRADATFRLEPHDVAHVTAICRAVDGSPLGIELAAAWVRAVPLATLANETRRDLAGIVGEDDARASPRPGARASFERSWRRLDERQRQALARLSVFAGGFGPEAARQVAQASLTTLASLVDASLLSVGDDERYARHPLIHRFARERLAAEPDEERRVALRHAELFLGRLAAADPDARHAPSPALLALERDFEDLRAAWDAAIRHGRPDLIAAAALPLARLCDARARLRDGAASFAAVDQAVADEDATWRRARGRSRLGHAWMLVRLGRVHEAETMAAPALDPSRAPADPEARAWGLGTMATAAYKAGRYDRARELFGRLHDLATDLGDEALRGEARGRQALVAQAVGRDDEARRHYLAALDAARSCGDDASHVTQLLNLGALELNVGRTEAARERFEEGRRLATALGYEQVLPILLHNLANVRCKAGAYAEAIALARDARQRVATSGERGLESGMLATLGWIELEAGDPVAARRDVLEALRLARAIDDEPAAATALVRLAQVWIAEGRTTPAARVLDGAIAHPATLTWARRLAGRLRRELGTDPAEVRLDPPPSLASLADGILAAG